MDWKEYDCGDSKVRIPVPRSYGDCWQLVRSDAYRHNGRHDSLFKIILGSFSRPSIRWSIWFRLAQHRGPLRSLARWRAGKFKRKYGIFIPVRTPIGYGLYIGHLHSIVINPTAVIGNNVTISQQTTIGANDGPAAVIADNVYMGPGVKTVEDVHIGDRAIIGAGAVVTRDIPPGATAAGVPARVIGRGPRHDYVKHPWKL